MNAEDVDDSKEKLKKLGEFWMQSLKGGNSGGEGSEDKDMGEQEEGEESEDYNDESNDVQMEDVEMDEMDELQQCNKGNGRYEGRVAHRTYESPYGPPPSRSATEITRRTTPLYPPGLNIPSRSERERLPSPEIDSDAEEYEEIYHKILGVDVILSTVDVSESDIYLYNHPTYGPYRCHDPSNLRICWTACYEGL